jgi:pimeloyl-ACP methyl ester carboxylesterase
LPATAAFEWELTARGVQTIAFDAPGVGESTAYTRPRRMPGVVRTIEAMLDALGYDRIDVLGVSLGGVVAQQLAHQVPWLHTLRQPTLVLAGDDDPIVPLPNGRILAHRIPDARLHIVHGGGHLFLLEQPAEMAALVARFLAKGR